MGEKRVGLQADEGHDLREIPKWTRRYAQNRTLRDLVGIALSFVLGGVYAGLIAGIMVAYKRSDHILIGVLVIVLAGCVAFCLRYLPLMRSIMERLYGKEGTVSLDPKRDFPVAGRPSRPVLIASVLALNLLLWLALDAPGVYGEPIAALGYIPLLIYQWAKSRPSGSPFLLLAPALLGLHALLLIAGVPIYVRVGGDYERLANVIGPIVAYGLVAVLAGHVYSRVALRRLRALARSPESADGATEAGR
jgi:cytochrome c biogenesis protein CcdA